MLMKRPPCGLARGSFRLSLGLVLIPFEPHTACSAGERVHDKKPEAAAGQAQGADGRRRLRRGGVQSANPGKWDHGHGARCLSSCSRGFHACPQDIRQHVHVPPSAICTGSLWAPPSHEHASAYSSSGPVPVSQQTRKNRALRPRGPRVSGTEARCVFGLELAGMNSCEACPFAALASQAHPKNTATCLHISLPGTTVSPAIISCWWTLI
jgi:hypothetical protein